MPRAEAILSREILALARFLKPGLRDERVASDPSWAVHDLDWTLLLALAERHRVTPALETVLRSRLDVPEAIRTALNLAARSAILDELALAGSVKEIAARAQQAGLQLGILKGVPLSLMLHRRIGLRISRDIDLLVAPDQVVPALTMLDELGFRPRHPLPSSPSKLAALMRRQKDVELIHSGRQQIVELHWRLFDNARLLALPTPLPLDMVTLPMDIDVLTLPPQLNLLYLANHGCQHGWSRLKWLVDFAGLAERWSPDDLAALYQATPFRDGRRALGQALLLSADLFGLILPPALDRRLRRDWRVTTLVRMAKHCLAASGPAELETMRFGSTVKNISHYLLSASAGYLFTEIRLDLSHRVDEPAESPWRRFGIAGRLASWLRRHGSMPSQS